MKRKLMTIAITGLLGPAASMVYAQTPTLYLGSYGGSTQKAFEEDVLPAFEKANKVRVVYVPGNSTDTLGKLQAQKNNPELDVVMLDDGPMYQAVQFGFCDKIDKQAPVYKDLYPIADIGPNALGIGLVATGLFYNEEAYKKEGLKPPTSWHDLENPQLEQRIVIPPLNNTYGLHTLLKFAKLNGGSEKNPDPGFDAMIKKINPNVLAWEPSPGGMTSLFQNGEAILGVWGNGRVEALKATGFPVKFVYPKEGAMALLTAACPVVKSDVPQLAQKLVQYLATPEVQVIFARTQSWGPVNKTVKLTGDDAQRVVYGDAVDKLEKTDWDIVNKKRAEWNDRWTRTVER